MRIVLISLASLLLVPACGDDGGGTTPIDAPAPVRVVPCGGAAIAAEVTTVGFAFDPAATTISAGEIVRFTMPSDHNAVSDTAGQFRADFSAATCVRFDVAGSYPFHCEPHQFTGTITVQ